MKPTTKLLFMKKILLLSLFIFSSFSYAQEELNIYDSYLQELLKPNEEKTSNYININNISNRKATVEKITSDSYNDPSYLKTAMVLHMLKYILGDEDYDKNIYTYLIELEQNNQTATFKSFKESLEAQSNLDISNFMNDWFVGKGFPSYEITWFQNEDTHTISITVDQSQSDTSVSFFEMPFPIKVTGENGEFQFIRLELSDNKQSFTGILPFKITKVDVDPEYQIISKNNKVKNGIDQEVLNTEIALFPNPARNSLNIQNASDAVVEKVSIYNMLGKLVLQETNPIAAINLRPLSFGIHLVKIETSQGTLHKTILKEQ